jgi:predicted permease
MSWRRFFHRAAWDAERAREMDAHLRMQADDLIADGLPPDDAWREARRAFGNPRTIREDIYDMNTVALVEQTFRDVRYATRVLRKSPGFTLTAILTLTLAIGVNIAVFSAVDAVLLKPLPYPEPDRLALVATTIRAEGTTRGELAQHGLTWETIRDHAATFDAAVFSSWTTGVNLAAGGSAAYVQQQRVSGRFFSVLGVRPAAGREFSAEEDRTGGPAAVILSFELWQRLYGADPNAIGASLMLRGAPHTVVGIMPRGFRTDARPDLWTPLRPTTSGEGGGENYRIVARLRSGVTWPRAVAEMAALGADVVKRRPGLEGRTLEYSLVPLQKGLTSGLRQPLLLVWAAVGIILVIASVNLAGLLLARGSARRREIATRMALGSGRGAVLRQLVVESLVLGLAGGVLGIALGALGLESLQRVAEDAFQIAQPIALDVRAAAAGLAWSLISALLFGIVPAFDATRGDVRTGLAAGASRTATAARSRLRKVVVVAQVALGVALLVGAGLLLRTFSHLRGLDAGFDPDGVQVASVSLQDARYRTADTVVRLFDGVLSELKRTPGIDAAAVSLGVPYERLLNLGFDYVGGPAAVEPGRTMTSATYVSSGFFEALRVPLRAGRAFADTDRADSPGVAIVNEAFVARYFPDLGVERTRAVGRRIAVAGREREIVGVAGNVQVKPGWGDHGPLAPMPLTYIPVAQVSDGFLRLVHGWFSPAFVVRTKGPDAAEMLRRAIQAADPLLPIAAVRSMAVVRSEAIAQPRLLMTMLLVLASAAVLLAAIGIHGLISTSVGERTREIGIRLALGATAGAAIRTVALPGVLLALGGAAVGIPIAVFFVRLVRHFIWGVSPTDPVTFAAAALGLIVVASVASIVPALRILRLDPAMTLRHE